MEDRPPKAILAVDMSTSYFSFLPPTGQRAGGWPCHTSKSSGTCRSFRLSIDNQVVETQRIPGRTAVIDSLEAHAAKRRTGALPAEAQDAERWTVEEKLRRLGGGI